MLAAETFRMGGHATHDDAGPRRVLGPEPYGAWARRDPLALCRAALTERDVSPGALAAAAAEAEGEVADGVAAALASRAARMPNWSIGVGGVYAG